MSNKVQESYTPKPMTVSGVLLGEQGGALGGFLCTTAGTLKLSYGALGASTTIVDTFDVAEGVFYPMPFMFPVASEPVYATLTGAAGTFALNYGN